MKARELFAVAAALWLTLGAGPAIRAETLAPAQAQEDDAAPATADAPTDGPATDDGIVFGLYVGVGYGTAEAKDLDLDIFTTSSHASRNLFAIEDQSVSLAEIGWRLPYNKGDFRLTFNGYREEEYSLQAVGLLAQVQGDMPLAVTQNIQWYQVGMQNGVLATVRNPPQWTSADDANGNMAAEPDEVRYDPMNAVTTSRAVTDDLQNRTQTIDAKYGRTFGGRRYNGHWWAGARYFAYDGNIPLTAWLSSFTAGNGFTDGSLIRLLNARQEARAAGPLGAIEARFNYFNDRLQLFASGEAAFVIMSSDIDTGDFFTIIEDSSSGTISPVPARLGASRSKSTWQNRGEVGVRVRLKNGVTLEAAYNVTGYLDARLVPTELRIPENEQEAGQGSSALFITRDIVNTGWRTGASFQF